MHPNLSNRFLTFHLSAAEETTAKAVNPYFLAYLQNKIAAYANAIVEESYDSEKNQVDSKELTLIRHERLKAQVLVLEELFVELKPLESAEQGDQQNSANPFLPPQP